MPTNKLKSFIQNSLSSGEDLGILLSLYYPSPDFWRNKIMNYFPQLLSVCFENKPKNKACSIRLNLPTTVTWSTRFQILE